MVKYIFSALSLCLHIFSVYFIYEFELLNWLLARDISYISFLILGLYYCLICYLNIKTLFEPHKLETAYKKKMYKENKDKRNQTAWFISDIFIGLGMLGTVVGFIFMFDGVDITSINRESQESILVIISGIFKSLATALVTTGVGLVTSMLTRIHVWTMDE